MHMKALFCSELIFSHLQMFRVQQKHEGHRTSKKGGAQGTLTVCKILTAHRKQQERDCKKHFLSDLSLSFM